MRKPLPGPHRCAVTGCETLIKPERFLCFQHWFPLTPSIKNALSMAYRHWTEADPDSLVKLRQVQHMCLEYLDRLQRHADGEGYK